MAFNSPAGAAHPPPQPLMGDPARQAIDSLLGYDYQIWRTVEAWLRLQPGQTLYIECAEDFDVIAPAGSVANQVKNSPATVTLNSEDVKQAIANFWALRRRNAGRGPISLRFLTRGAIGKEKNSQLGSAKGLELWSLAAVGDQDAAAQLVQHLQSQGGADDFIRFLKESSPDQLRAELFSRIEWAVEEPSIEAVKLSVERMAINWGSARAISSVVAQRAVPALLARCREVAVQDGPELRSLAIEDALLCFESNTNLPVPMTNRLLAAIGAVGGGALTFSSASFDGELPDLPMDGLPRREFLGQLDAAVRAAGCVLIVGSEGEGKSTAGNMLARSLGISPFWMDLRGGDEAVAAAAIENALLLVRSPQRPDSIALDDVPVAQGVPDSIWGPLAVLIAGSRRARIPLAMTSRGVPADNVDPRFKAIGVPVVTVPRISEQEMVEYFSSLGCPAEHAQMWARMTRAHSGAGHPKLVHLAALELRDRGWRADSAADVISAPRSIEEARAHARQSACKVVPQPDRDMLFALSLSNGAFDRTFAMDLGTRLGLSEPGAAFDRLAGRWLEHIGSAGFKATPLLNHQTEKIWPADRVRCTHATILRIHLARKSLRVDEAMDLFLHAFQAQDRVLFLRFVSGLASKVDEVPHLAEALEVLVAVGEDSDSQAIPFDEHCSLLFRFLQFRIAKERRPEAVAKIAQRWLQEIEQASDRELAAMMRSMRGLAVASAIDCSLPVDVIAQALKDAAGIEQLGVELPLLPDDMRVDAGRTDAMEALFLIAQSGIETASGLSQLLDELSAFAPDFRGRLLGAYDSRLALQGFSTFSRVLVGLARLPGPDWAAFAGELQRAMTLGASWNAPAFVAEAARVRSIVLDEYLADPERAVATLEEASAAGANTQGLKAQMGNVAFRAGDFAKALELWEVCLSGGQQGGVDTIYDPFASRRAAIAAAKLGRMRRAAEWLQSAAELAAGKLRGLPVAPFRIDACYCWFKCGDPARALSAAALARREVHDPVDPKEAPRQFAAQKFLGHVLLWLWKFVDGQDIADEPAVGMSSNPDLDLDSIGQLPPTPGNILDMAMVETARAFDVQAPWLAECEGRLARCTVPFVALRYRAGNLRRCLREGAHCAAAVEIYHLYEEFLVLRGMADSGVADPLNRGEPPDEGARRRYAGTALNWLLHVLAVARMRRADIEQILAAWRVSLQNLAHAAPFGDIVEAAAAAFEVDASRAIELVRTSPDSAARVAAAATLLAQDSRGALETAQAQWVLCWMLFGGVSMSVIAPEFGSIAQVFANQWEQLAANPALLANPRLSQGALRAAMASDAPPALKLFQLAQAAELASGASMPKALRGVLNNLVEGESVRVERVKQLRATAEPPAA